MLDKRAKAKLEKYMPARKRALGRLIYIAYRHFNEWAQKKWKEDGWDDIRPEHLRLISIISLEPVSNNELAQRARVSKQAMSKMVNLLEEKGFIDVVPHPSDSRSKMISVSNEGVDFMTYFLGCSIELKEKYAKMIGKEKMEKLIDLLSELTECILEEESIECALAGK